MTLPVGAERQPPEEAVLHRLDPRYIPLRRAVGWLATATVSLALLLFLAPVLLVSPPSPWARYALGSAWAVVTLGLGTLLQVWPPLSYRHSAYRADAEGLELRRGVLWRRVIRVPRSRIQHSEVTQGPLERRYGLARLSVYTAGTAYARVTVPGLEHGLALELRSLLQPHEEGGGDVV